MLSKYDGAAYRLIAPGANLSEIRVEYYNAQFILDCIAQNTLLDIEPYRCVYFPWICVVFMANQACVFQDCPELDCTQRTRLGQVLVCSLPVTDAFLSLCTRPNLISCTD